MVQVGNEIEGGLTVGLQWSPSACLNVDGMIRKDISYR